MRHPAKVYPEHRCCSCTRMTTLKTYCPLCLDSFMRIPYVAQPIMPTADSYPMPRYRKNESINTLR